MHPSFDPRDPNFEQKVRASFDKQAVMQTIGAELTQLAPGQVEISMPFNPRLTQQHGFLHGGIVTTLLDSACGYAALSLMPAEAGILSIEFKVNLLSPATGETFRALGRVRKPGRNITVAEGELLVDQDGRQKPVASMVATMMSIYGREGISD